MGCVSCSKRKPKAVNYSYPVIKAESKPCNLSESEIKLIRDQLFCLRSKIPFKDFNKYLGTINSLLTLSDYCRYDITNITRLIKQYGCNI